LKYLKRKGDRMGRFSPDRDLKIVGGSAPLFLWRLIKLAVLGIAFLYFIAKCT
jgi:hypothetical protein